MFTATEAALLEGCCSVARAAAGCHVIGRLAPNVAHMPGRAVDKEKAFCPLAPPATDANAQNVPAMARAKHRRAPPPASALSSNASLTGSATVLVCASHSRLRASVSVRYPQAPASHREGCAGC
ncbi:hypothetical protein SVAN01_10660 [Stagonosporopsis vannaccii]|nr:hypothetical protein SVAN01_10660 [Stagonosporopsis vannaccii]